MADVLLLLRKVLSGKRYRQYRGLSNRLKLEKQEAPSERELARVSETEGECGIKEFFLVRLRALIPKSRRLLSSRRAVPPSSRRKANFIPR